MPGVGDDAFRRGNCRNNRVLQHRRQRQLGHPQHRLQSQFRLSEWSAAVARAGPKRVRNGFNLTIEAVADLRQADDGSLVIGSSVLLQSGGIIRNTIVGADTGNGRIEFNAAFQQDGGNLSIGATSDMIFTPTHGGTRLWNGGTWGGGGTGKYEIGAGVTMEVNGNDGTANVLQQNLLVSGQFNLTAGSTAGGLQLVPGTTLTNDSTFGLGSRPATTAR